MTSLHASNDCSLLNYRGGCNASWSGDRVNKSDTSYFHQSRRICHRNLCDRCSYSRSKHTLSPLANQLWVTAAAVESFGHDQNSKAEEINELTNTSKTIFTNALSLYRFSRPHTMLGTFVSVTSISLLALGSHPWNLPAILSLVQALLSALLMNICIVGINQVSKIEVILYKV